MKIQNLIYTTGAVCLLSMAVLWSNAKAACIPACTGGARCEGNQCIYPTTAPTGTPTNLTMNNDNPVEPKITSEPVIPGHGYTQHTDCEFTTDSSGNITRCCKTTTVGGI